MVVLEAAKLVVKEIQLARIILVRILVGAVTPVDKVIHSAQIATPAIQVTRAVQWAKIILGVIPVAATLAKVVQLGKIPLVAVEAATQVVKATQLGKTILAVIPV